MSEDRYFINFPVINYNSVNAVNITERVVFLNSALRNPYLFYPYDITDDERADQFANRYYGDSYKSWVLYLGNKIIDPYYQWYMNNDDFNQYIIKKYGNIILAQTKTKYYENNWYSSSNISVNDYDALPYTLLKYWEPIFGNYNNIIGYKRKQLAQTVTTNSIRSYNVSNTSFNVDEICNMVFDNTHIGQGQILSINSNTNMVYIQHTSGTTLSNTSVFITANSYIYGQESNVNTAFTTASNVIDNLLPEEVLYWTPVSYYDYESSKNEYNKSIVVLDNSYAASVVNGLKGLLE
jgi:hypothetical protein